MPIYEYRCERGHTFEVMQRMTDDPVSSCQTCDARVHRVFHPVAVHFKGSGFYNTDYGTRKRSREQKEGGEGSGGDGAGGESSGGEASATKGSGGEGSGSKGTGGEGSGAKTAGETKGSAEKKPGASKTSSSSND